MQRTHIFTGKLIRFKVKERKQNIDKNKNEKKRNKNDLWLQKCRQTLFVEDNSG